MAAGTDQNYVDYGEYIDFQLQKTQNQIKATDFFVALIGIVTFLISYLLIFTLLDHWVIPGGFSNGMRLALLTIIILISGTWVFFKVVIPFRKKIKTLFAARTIESSSPELNNSLLNLINIEQSRESIRGSIYRSMEKQAAVSLTEMDISQVVDRKKLISLSFSLLAAVVFFCLYAIFSPKDISFWRPLIPFAAVDVSTITEILLIEPGDTKVIAQSELPISVELSGKIPENVYLFYSTEDQQYVDERVELKFVDEGLKRYETILNGENGRGILQNMTYRIEAGDAFSKEFHITVNRPPSVTVEKISFKYPKYMKLSDKSQTEGDIKAWEGTKVQLTAQTNIKVNSAVLYFEDKVGSKIKAEELRMKIKNGKTLHAEWELAFRSDGTSPKFYYIECQSEGVKQANKPTRYSINIFPDRPPVIVLKYPTNDLTVPSNAIIPLLVEAADPDFLLRSLDLIIEKNGEVLPAGFPLFNSELKKNIRVSYDWELEHLALKPGDQLSFWIEARDNKQPTSNRTNTPRMNFVIIEPQSDEEIQEELNNQKEEQDFEAEEQEKNENGKQEQGSDKEQKEQPEEENRPAEENSEQKQQGNQSEDEAEGNDKEGKPNQNQDDNQQSKGSGNEGEESDKSSQSGENNNNQEDSEDNQSEEQSAEGKGENGPSKKADDEQALKKMIEKYSDKEKQSKQNSDQKQNPRDQQNKSSEGKSRKEKDPSELNSDKENQENPDQNKPSNNSDKNQKERSESQDNSSNQKKNDQSKNNPNEPDKNQDKQNTEKPDQGSKTNQQRENKTKNENSGENNSKREKQESPDSKENPQSDPENKSDINNSKDNKSDKEQDPQSPSNSEEKGKGSEPEDQNKQSSNDKKKGSSDNSSSEKQNGGGEKKESDKSSSPEEGNKNGDPSQPDKKNQKTQKGTGDEKGEGSAGDPDKESTKAKNKIKRKKDEKPATRDQDPDEKENQDQTNQAKSQEDQGNKKNSSKQNNNQKEQPDKNKKSGEDKNKSGNNQKNNPEEKGSKKSSGKQDQQNNKKNGKPGKSKSESKKQSGKKGNSSEKSSDKKSQDKDGSPGDKKGSQSDKGKPGGKKPGEGGKKQGQGKKGSPGKSQGKKPSSGESSQGDSENIENSKSESSPSNGKKPGQGKVGGGSKPSDNKSDNNEKQGAGGKAQNGNKEQNNGGGKQDSSEKQDDEANAEFTRKAANLVLQRIKDDLSRGKVDKKLLKELGWTEKDMAKFAERLKKQIANRNQEESPENQAKRQQFEEMLKNMRLQKINKTRKEKPGRVLRDTGFGGRKIPLPPQYREAYEAYSKEVSKGKK
jgi:collagen type III alpha